LNQSIRPLTLRGVYFLTVVITRSPCTQRHHQHFKAPQNPSQSENSKVSAEHYWPLWTNAHRFVQKELYSPYQVNQHRLQTGPVVIRLVGLWHFRSVLLACDRSATRATIWTIPYLWPTGD
jgi:hypothetical protein